eukprot:2725127-Alexandrium_andersonii.AAC.1
MIPSRVPRRNVLLTSPVSRALLTSCIQPTELVQLVIAKPLLPTDVLNCVTHGHRGVRRQVLRERPHELSAAEETALIPQESSRLPVDLVLEVL